MLIPAKFAFVIVSLLFLEKQKYNLINRQINKRQWASLNISWNKYVDISFIFHCVEKLFTWRLLSYNYKVIIVCIYSSAFQYILGCSFIGHFFSTNCLISLQDLASSFWSELTLCLLGVNFEDRWWPKKTIWIQMRPLIWDPNCLKFRLYISKTFELK